MGGVAMGRIVLNNLTASFAGESSYVGPRVDHGDFVNIASICGEREGNGPLGAMCDVLEIATTDFVVFAPCDTPFFAVADFKRLIDTAGTHDVEATRDHMVSAYASGERAIHRAVLGLNVFDQQFPSDVLTNVNTPLDAQ
jgi:molybdopterin-guanine dinucleotide biosynthesis protein A